MRANRLLRVSVFAVLLTFFLLPEAAHATDVTVVCPNGAVGAFSSISAALAALPQNGPNTITVTGTCNEPQTVSITDMRSLTIVAGAGLGSAKIIQPQDSDTLNIIRSQNITLQNLEIVGVPGSTLGFGGIGVGIYEASDVQILGCDIHDNEGDGINVNGRSLLFVNSTNIHNNTPADGLDVSDSDVNVRTTTIQNNGCVHGSPACSSFGGIGVFAARNAVVSLRNNTLIQNNGDIGILARLLSTVALDARPNQTIIIQGHDINGIFLQEGARLVVGATLIRGNGGACPAETAFPCGGLVATENSTVEMRGIATITGNHGAGILVEQGANVHLGGAVTVSNNSGDGVHIERISIGDFTPIPGSGSSTNTITGNGGASVFCDSRSLAIGDLSTFSNVRCGQE